MIKLQVNSKKMYVDGRTVILDVPPVQIDDCRTLVPIRAVSEAFGFAVYWDEVTKTVTICDRQKYFETIDDCAYDWAMHWNAMSIALFREMNGVIYKDNNGYYWDNVRIGKDKEAVFDTVQAKKGVALIHSHGGGEQWNTRNMSRADFDTAKRFKKPLYMTDSGGCLWEYNPNKDKPKQRYIKSGCPKDARWMDIENSAKTQREYFSNCYHDLREYEFGFKADYYNKLHMSNLNYYEGG